jgi:hypothetical protein
LERWLSGLDQSERQKPPVSTLLEYVEAEKSGIRDVQQELKRILQKQPPFEENNLESQSAKDLLKASKSFIKSTMKTCLKVEEKLL